MSKLYDGFGCELSKNIETNVIEYDEIVKSINHRGYNSVAPENTLHAFRLSKQKGFNYVECDISFTSDGIPVLLHDSTIDRTSNGTGSISSLTYEQVSQYDFGSWKSQNYAGTKIPTFEEFILLCKTIGLCPYIELKNNGGYSSNNVSKLIDIVKKYGMSKKVTWISYNSTFLGYVKSNDETARLGFLCDTTTDTKAIEAVTTCQSLKTEKNEVFVDCGITYLNDTRVNYFVEANIPVECYMIGGNTTNILNANKYITGFTLDVLIAGKELYESNIN